MTGCRISKVRMKDGGATIHPLHPTARSGRHHRELMRHASMICDWYPDGKMAGFVVIGFDAEGEYTIGYHLGEDTPVRPALLPSWVADIIRRRFIQNGVWTDD